MSIQNTNNIIPLLLGIAIPITDCPKSLKNGFVAQPSRPFIRLCFLAYVVDAVTNYCSHNIIY